MTKFLSIGTLALLLSAPSIAATGREAAQVGTADVQRLEESLNGVESDIRRLESRDASLAGRLGRELDELRDEVTYLKVKARRAERIERSELTALSDKVEALGRRAREGGRSPADPNEVPVGAEVDVRLQTRLSSATAAVEDRFEATTLVDLYQDERVLIPAGSVMRGVVSAVDRATRTDRKGSLTLSFDRLTVDGKEYPIRAIVADAIESQGIRGEAGRIGTGAGVGAIIGGILGGFKGALAGILIGGGGVVAATEGKDVELPAGTVLRVRFDQPVKIAPSDARR
jgi:hypothetical protein